MSLFQLKAFDQDSGCEIFDMPYFDASAFDAF